MRTDVLSKRKMIILYSAIIALVVFGCNLIIRPQIKKLAGLNKKVAIQEIRLKKNLGIISKRDYIVNQHHRYLTYIEEDKLYETKLATSPLEEIERIARDCELFVSEIKPLKADVVEMKAEASINSVISFIYALQNSPDFLRIEKMRLSGKKGSSGVLKADLQIGRILDDYLSAEPIEYEKIDSPEVGEFNLPLKTLRPLEYYTSVVGKRGLFKPPETSKKDPAEVPLAIKQMVKNLNLVGIIKDEEYQVVIEDRRAKEIHSVYKGDFIGEIMIEDIFEDKVILSYGGDTIDLSL